MPGTKRFNRGMTLAEVLVAFAIGAMALGIALSMWHFVYKNWTIERDYRTKLRGALEIATEKIKEEIRTSSATYTSLYKAAGADDYTAISFPAATTITGGFFTLANNRIAWDESIIYHVYYDDDKEENQLRRTEFTVNGDILTNKSQRDLQLVKAVTNGDGSGGPKSATGVTTTKVILRSLSDFKIIPKSGWFDGYSPALARSDKIKFGTIDLSPGDRAFKFEVIGKNPANTDATGYGFGIDVISITPSGCQREAEACAVSAHLGSDYSTVSAPSWSGANYLQYSATAEGHYLTLTLPYDEWLESNFANSIRDNTIITEDYLRLKLCSPKEGRSIYWQASEQTENLDTATQTFTGVTSIALRNSLLTTFLDIIPGQKLVRLKFVNASSSQTITIDSANIAERAYGAATKLSAGVSTGDGTIPVNSTDGFSSPGSAYIYDSNGLYDIFSYTGKTTEPHAFTGVTGLTRAYAAGDPILDWRDDTGPVTQLTSDVAAAAATINVSSTSGFPSSGSAYLYKGTGLTYEVFTYTGTTATTFTGVTGITGTYAVASSDKVRGVPKGLYFSESPVAIGSFEAETAGNSIEGTPGTTPTAVNLSSESYIYSNWAEFTIDTSKDYFVTLGISTTLDFDATYWQDLKTVPTTNSYSTANSGQAELPQWSASTARTNLYTVGVGENWVNIGTVVSLVYDTGIDNETLPDYKKISWASSVPDGTSLAVWVRASDSEDMSSISWVAVIDGSEPSGVDGKRYIQFRAELATSSPYSSYPWIDNVAIDWSGVAGACEISGYFTKKPDYGIIKLTIDGNEIMKAVEFQIELSEAFQENDYEASSIAGVKLRNTDK